MTGTIQLLALLGDLPARLAAGDPDLVRPLASVTGTLGAALVAGAEGRPARHDPAALATALSVRLPGWPVVSFSDGRGDHPYNTARRFLSVDHLSGGRSGVLFQTGGARAQHTAERIQVVRALWNSWPLDSLVADRDTGVYAHTDEIREIDHQGADFRVHGALNTPSSIQGEPVSLWHVSTAEELDAAHGLVDLVVLDDPDLLHRWRASEAEARPGLVAAGIVHGGEAAAELVSVSTTAELFEAVATLPPAPLPPGLPAGEHGRAAPTLRALFGLPPRSFDLSSKPLAFGASRA
ncbi:LLM class flavin-dependent oxidoreductase [Arthrobacter sp. HMWF013]|uniref:LLM class flavin-dependent oxidoreductase n=1 Tax=Arthrobacter sp. HMWF013 TaxID=2056849 RepID=UPI000D381AC1|nr:LLM class flavin-dependent oxidoreductase [Arthrobacter sp. HMWF013]PTT63766.1 hypothetical protein DBR22_15230 [Arthrobacter sp. HMWF013]